MNRYSILFLMILVLPLYGQDIQTTQYINMRSKPHVTAEIIAVIPKAKKFQCIDIFGDYYKVKGDINKKIYINGWVWSKLLKQIDSKSIKMNTAFDVVDNAIVRSQPGKDGKLIGVIPKGNKVYFREAIITWYLIKYNGKQGWVSEVGCKKIKK